MGACMSERRRLAAARSLGRLTPPHMVTLMVAAATNTMSQSVFLPSLPAIGRYFDADYGVVQLTVSLYLAATAILQLGIGPASDRFGRRPVMLVCLGVFLVASIGVLAAASIEILLVFRVFQAFSAAGVVLSRAIVRDTVPTEQAASKIGYVTMGVTFVPMFAPTIGGLLDEAYGWRSTFWLIFGFGLVATLIIFLDLGETNHARADSFGAQVRSYPELARSRRFWGYTATASFISGSFFAFLGGGPFVATEILGLSPTAYGLYYATISAGYVIGNFSSGRFARRVGLNRMLLAGGLVASTSMVLAFAASSWWPDSALAIFGPMALLGVGQGLALPSANAGIVGVRPHIAGSAAGLGGALQIGGGAALSVLAGTLLSKQTGAAPLLWVMLASSLMAVAATLYVMRVARTAGDL